MSKTPIENIHYKNILRQDLNSCTFDLQQCSLTNEPPKLTEALPTTGLAIRESGETRLRSAPHSLVSPVIQWNVWVFYKTFARFYRKPFKTPKKTLGSYSEELAHSNWMILLWGMSHKDQGVLVPFDFPNYYFYLLTYLLTERLLTPRSQEPLQLSLPNYMGLMLVPQGVKVLSLIEIEKHLILFPVQNASR